MTDLARELADIYGVRAHERYGLESISQLQHALQAAMHADQAGEPPAMILAALLHDIGHMVGALGENPAGDGVDDRHEELGADWLAPKLGRAVSEPVRLHVAAKRYLCAVEPGYSASLAPDSVLSLGLQGGPMLASEIELFRATPFADEAVRLRRYDELAKVDDAITPEFGYFLKNVSRISIA